MATELTLLAPATEVAIVEELRTPAWRQLWRATWPRLGALVLLLGGWQAVVLSGWKPDYLLPGPVAVLGRLGQEAQSAVFYQALGTTGARAVSGFALALAIGSATGLAVASSRSLRAAVGALLTGLQSMPSIAWFPLAILLFGLSEAAITFVVVLGAAPAIANGLIAGLDHVPPLLLRYGRVAGARGLALYRHVALPAALPTFFGGLKQGSAFAWRSLLAGELLVMLGNRPSLGSRLQFARELSDSEALLAGMLVVLLVGIGVDALFGVAGRAIGRRWGLMEA
jgi:NitT/TauT family transport system permease protein